MRHVALKIFLCLAGAWAAVAVAQEDAAAPKNAPKPPTAPSSSVEYAEISHPVLSGHCQHLLQQRQQKIQFRNRIGALIFRNQNILQRLQPHQTKLRHDLEINRRSLDREYYLALLKIQKMTEDILRRGCPGIEL